MTAIRMVRVAQSDLRQEAFWRAAFMSQGMSVVSVPLARSLAEVVAPGIRRMREPELLLVDLADLAADGLRLPEFGRRLRRNAPDLTLAVTLASRLEISLPERRWALRQGAVDFLPALSLAEDAPLTLERVSRLAVAAGAPPVDRDQLSRGLRILLGGIATAPGGDVAVELARRGIDIAGAARRMRGPGGVACEDRRYRLKRYPNCFIGTVAVDWLVAQYGLSRDLAVAAGQALLERGVLYHVVKDHAFEDEPLFYRFADPASTMDNVDIDALVERMTGADGVAIADRRHLGKVYPACFIGSEAVDWLAAKFEITREDAVTVGQRLVDLYLVRHVVDEHDFIDAGFFYRFTHAAV